jgi:hypothetical protein
MAKNPLPQNRTTPKSFKNILGLKFGRLTVVERGPNTAGGSARWYCRCECSSGKRPLVVAGALRNGTTQSCGCLQKERASEASTGRDRKTHGMTESRLYVIWAGMIQRCTNQNRSAYDDYGGRGIRVCDKWLNNFQAFYEDVGDPPSPAHSIDRYPDKNGNYEPINVRWATSIEQNNNARHNHMVIFRGEEMTVAQAIRVSGSTTPKGTIYTRLWRGWRIEDALS